MTYWLPMSEAPRDGTVILGRTRSDMPEDENLPQWSAHRWNDRFVPMKHEGCTPSDCDLGWSVALPVGHGGLPDDWFVGWKPISGDGLHDALAGFGDDYMTSEQHHPGYVLIPTEQFERIRAAMGAE